MPARPPAEQVPVRDAISLYMNLMFGIFALMYFYVRAIGSSQI